MTLDPLKNLTLLYVEDDDTVRRNAVEYLSRLCRSVYEAANGKEAITIWRAQKPDIIITDISMPRMNGLDMAAYIRAHDEHVQIIVATAYTDTPYLMQAVELQLVKYLVKPVTGEKLQNALEQTLARIEDKSKFSIFLSDNCSYNVYTKQVECNGNIAKLTRNEALFLDLLAHHHTRVVYYQEIENAVWPVEGMTQDAIRSLVRALRKKLPEGTIENISGIGYRLMVTSREERLPKQDQSSL